MANIYLIIGVCFLSVLSKCQGENKTSYVEMPEEHINLTVTSVQGGIEVPSGLLKLEALGKRLEKLESTVRALEDTNRRLEASEALLAAHKTAIRTLTQDQPRVAFTAARPLEDGVQQGSLTAGSAVLSVVYKHAVSNFGNAYSPVSGYFTAPVSGVYYFSFNSFLWDSGTTGGSLYQNGNQVVSWYSSYTGGSSGSNFAVLQLSTGDQVNVRIWPNRKISENTNTYCTFSGFLLFPV